MTPALRALRPGSGEGDGGAGVICAHSAPATQRVSVVHVVFVLSD